MKVKCEKLLVNAAQIGWKIKAENKDDYKKLKQLIDRVTLIHCDEFSDVSEMQMNVRYEEEDCFILYKNTRDFDLRNEEKDVSVDELEKFIDMLKETKEEVCEKEVRVYEI